MLSKTRRKAEDTDICRQIDNDTSYASTSPVTSAGNKIYLATGKITGYENEERT